MKNRNQYLDIKSTSRRCPACMGSEIQYNHKQGLRVRCPCCNGKGEIRV